MADGSPDLNALMAAAQRQASSAQPLDELRAAVGLAETLTRSADELLNRFVDQARAAGCAWSEIGAVLGVSKQAAQQHFVVLDQSAYTDIELPMTPRLRHVIRLAHKEAGRLKVEQAGSSHLLLGLLREGRGLACRVLADLDVDLEELAQALAAGDESTAAPGDSPTLTADAQRAMGLMLVEARSLGHHYVGTEHLLLGLLRLGKGRAYGMLADRGVTADDVRERALAVLDGPQLSQRRGRLRLRIRREHLG